MYYLKNILQNTFARRVLILAICVGVIYLLKDIVTIFLLSFILIFLTSSIQEFLHKSISKYVPVNRGAIIAFIYIFFFGLIALLITLGYLYIPAIVREIGEILNYVIYFIIHFDRNATYDSNIINTLLYLLRGVDISSYINIKSAGKYILTGATNFGLLGFNFLMAFILSMFFMLQKEKVYTFVSKFRESKIAWLYEDIKYFGEKFTNSFGKVIQAQITIAFVNALLSIIILWIMHFPKLLGLGTMIFFFGLVPVAGVIFSLIPLSIMAFNLGGFTKVIYVLILVAVLHSLETYILNPKLMSDKTKMPVFFTFIVLIVAEHFFGIWGLIVGIPITMFLLDLLEVNTNL